MPSMESIRVGCDRGSGTLRITYVAWRDHGPIPSVEGDPSGEWSHAVTLALLLTESSADEDKHIRSLRWGHR